LLLFLLLLGSLLSVPILLIFFKGENDGEKIFNTALYVWLGLSLLTGGKIKLPPKKQK
jgi:hypothetical protein